jgi:hypothetical protein
MPMPTAFDRRLDDEAELDELLRQAADALLRAGRPDVLDRLIERREASARGEPPPRGSIAPGPGVRITVRPAGATDLSAPIGDPS